MSKTLMNKWAGKFVPVSNATPGFHDLKLQSVGPKVDKVRPRDDDDDSELYREIKKQREILEELENRKKARAARPKKSLIGKKDIGLTKYTYGSGEYMRLGTFVVTPAGKGELRHRLVQSTPGRFSKQTDPISPEELELIYEIADQYKENGKFVRPMDVDERSDYLFIQYDDDEPSWPGWSNEKFALVKDVPKLFEFFKKHGIVE